MIGNDQLSAMFGHWAGTEELFETAWTAAGSAEAAMTMSPGPGNSLLIDYTEHREGTTLTGHGVVSAGAWWWFDSYGFLPTTPGSARWDDDTLLLERRSERGRTVTRLRIVDGRLEQRIDTAVPADAALGRLLLGTYARHPA